ncbi:hypothetical protein L9F63_017978 [Diploptera punctata]|uniref:Retinol dehydrogenase 12 n=1 Tax=Diploptera punctata TaxID=6984 RepID=A0AAD7ZZN2_DIPPU|nr:hypothetical protein L9F63_017978 [Diploptera punctata]
MWLLSGRCTSQARLDGKTAIVTGANCGIGQYTAYDFVKRGARVVIACRDLKKAEEAADEIRRDTMYVEGAGEVVVLKLDLSSIASIRECAREILRTEKKINILVNNAGVCYCQKSQTTDGFEMHIGVNHLGHFLFTCLLLPRIIRSAPARIVTVASFNNYFVNNVCLEDFHWEKRSFSPFFAYSESKLANVLFSAELAKRLQGSEVSTYSLHPGLVLTEAGRHVNPILQWFYQNVICYVCKTCEQGAQTTIHCAVSEEAGKETGLYYRDCFSLAPNSITKDEKVRQDLWKESVRLVGLGDWDPFTAQDSGELPPDCRETHHK